MPDAGSTPDRQISLDMVADRIGTLFGPGWQTTYGGGGTGGKYMFANLQDLDAVITQWTEVYTAIGHDGEAIRTALELVAPPAEDDMSVGQANATRDSLTKLKEHNEAMRSYAEEYIKKLQASRDSMTNTDQGNAAQLSNVDRS